MSIPMNINNRADASTVDVCYLCHFRSFHSRCAAHDNARVD